MEYLRRQAHDTAPLTDYPVVAHEPGPGRIVSMGIYLLIKEILLRSRIHLLKLDAYIRPP
jgi:hypothetical protein